jgi:hypothetical protein
MVKEFARAFGFCCLASLAGAPRPGAGVHASLAMNEGRVPSSLRETVARNGTDAESPSSEARQLALFGAGLTYLGVRLRKRGA